MKKSETNSESIQNAEERKNNRCREIASALEKDLMESDYILSALVNSISFFRFSTKSEEEMNDMIDKVMANEGNLYQDKERFLKELLRSIDVSKENVLRHIVNLLFNEESRKFDGTYMRMADIYHDLSDDKQQLLQKELNPFPDAWYHKSHVEYSQDQGKTQEAGRKIKEAIEKLCPTFEFRPYSDFHSSNIAKHHYVDINVVSSNIQQWNNMDDDRQGRLLTALDNALVINNEEVTGDRYITSAILNGLYESNKAKADYADLHLPQLFPNTIEEGFVHPPLDAQDLMVGFSLAIRYANKRNLKLSLHGDYAGLYNLYQN